MGPPPSLSLCKALFTPKDVEIVIRVEVDLGGSGHLRISAPGMIEDVVVVGDGRIAHQADEIVLPATNIGVRTVDSIVRYGDGARAVADIEIPVADHREGAMVHPHVVRRVAREPVASLD